MKTISCIIPAYNEARRIGTVLDAVLQVPAITEVLVIDDGSTDSTASVVRGLVGVQLLQQEMNQGKSAALARGIDAAQGEYVLFIDADLQGLTAPHIAALIEPVLAGRADVSFSLRFKGWELFGIDPISGERLIPRRLLSEKTAELRKLRPFAVETYMNGYIIAAQLSIAVVPWPDVQSPMKSRKYGFWKGLRADARMVRDILSVVSPVGYVQYALRLRRRRVPQQGSEAY